MKKFDVKDLLAVLCALLLTGLGVAAKHPEAALTLVAVLLVWTVNFLFRWKGIKLHRAWLTSGLYVLALLLTLLFQPALFPAWPVLSGESRQIASAIYSWIGMLIIAGGPIVAYATGLYNILLKRVLDKLLYEPQLK
jgi:hypothetical protein